MTNSVNMKMKLHWIPKAYPEIKWQLKRLLTFYVFSQLFKEQFYSVYLFNLLGSILCNYLFQKFLEIDKNKAYFIQLNISNICWNDEVFWFLNSIRELCTILSVLLSTRYFPKIY